MAARIVVPAVLKAAPSVPLYTPPTSSSAVLPGSIPTAGSAVLPLYTPPASVVLTGSVPASVVLTGSVSAQRETRDVVVALLIKDKAYCLAQFFNCLQLQTFPKKRTHLYIRTNNNNDNSILYIMRFIVTHGKEYGSVYYNGEDTKEAVERLDHHLWTDERVKVLGAIRDRSVKYAYQRGMHYFVVDCDNFINPTTLSDLYGSNHDVIGPLLTGNSRYANFHSAVDDNGYCRDDGNGYDRILFRQVRGCIPVAVIHCTYFIDYRTLPSVKYIDGSTRHEYIVFSDVLRKAGIQQYIMNDKEYGYLTLVSTESEFAAEGWSWKFPKLASLAAFIPTSNKPKPEKSTIAGRLVAFEGEIPAIAF